MEEIVPIRVRPILICYTDTSLTCLVNQCRVVLTVAGPSPCVHLVIVGNVHLIGQWLSVRAIYHLNNIPSSISELFSYFIIF